MAVAPQPQSLVAADGSSSETHAANTPRITKTKPGNIAPTRLEIAAATASPQDITSTNDTIKRDSANPVIQNNKSNDTVKRSVTTNSNFLLWAGVLSTIVLIAFSYFMYRRAHNS